MERRHFLGTLVGCLANLPIDSLAQSASRVYRVGFLGALTRESVADRLGALRAGLRDHGYVEGRNLIIEERWAEGKLERLPALAAELVRLKVDVIVSGGPAATGPAKAATSTIPIVMGMDNDPVAAGFVATLPRPGGNVTGVATLVPTLSSKQLEILREILPRLSRVAVIGSSNEPGNPQQFAEAERAAGTLGLRLTYADVLAEKDIAPAFRTARDARAEAVLVLTGPMLTFHRSRIAALAQENRLPSIFAHREAVRNGGLVTYGVHFPELFRRAAGYVDRILKGANPGELAIEQPTRFELIINLGTARALGITMPQTLLLRADEIIE